MSAAPSSEKVCTGCKCPYPATTKHFWRSKYERDGLRKRCKMCCRGTPGMLRRAEGSRP